MLIKEFHGVCPQFWPLMYLRWPCNSQHANNAMSHNWHNHSILQSSSIHTTTTHDAHLGCRVQTHNLKLVWGYAPSLHVEPKPRTMGAYLLFVHELYEGSHPITNYVAEYNFAHKRSIKSSVQYLFLVR